MHTILLRVYSGVPLLKVIFSLCLPRYKKKPTKESGKYNYTYITESNVHALVCQTTQKVT